MNNLMETLMYQVLSWINMFHIQPIIKEIMLSNKQILIKWKTIFNNIMTMIPIITKTTKILNKRLLWRPLNQTEIIIKIN